MNIFLENSLILKSLDESTRTILALDKSNTDFIKEVFEENKEKIKKFENNVDISMKNISSIDLEKYKQRQRIQTSARFKYEYKTIGKYQCQLMISRLNNKIVTIEILGEKKGKIKSCMVYRSFLIV